MNFLYKTSVPFPLLDSPVSFSFSFSFFPLKGLDRKKKKKMGRHGRSELVIMVVVMLGVVGTTEGALSVNMLKKIMRVNRQGPYLGIVSPNAFEMDPLLQSPSFVADDNLPYLDFAGRRFRIGKLETKNVIIVMTGLSMLNAGLATQLLINLFKVSGVLHYGIAGNANPNLQIGDVTVPKYWAHSGLWNWQRYGDGPEDELAFESGGDYTREIGYLKFSDYNTHAGNATDNLLNNVWYQPEEVFPVNGTPEVRQHAFWVPVNEHFYQVAGKLKDLKLEGCVNSTCLPRTPVVTRVERGVSANVFVDNGAYREFLYNKFNVTAIDMESAAVGLVCLQLETPFIAIRALSDLAGGGSALSNEAGVFASLAAQNSVDALVRFVALLYSS